VNMYSSLVEISLVTSKIRCRNKERKTDKKTTAAKYKHPGSIFSSKLTELRFYIQLDTK